MGLAASEEDLRDRLSRFVKAELKRAKLTYAELAEKLKEHGLPDESETSIKAKLKRGTFRSYLFFGCSRGFRARGGAVGEFLGAIPNPLPLLFTA